MTEIANQKNGNVTETYLKNKTIKSQARHFHTGVTNTSTFEIENLKNELCMAVNTIFLAALCIITLCDV